MSYVKNSAKVHAGTNPFSHLQPGKILLGDPNDTGRIEHPEHLADPFLREFWVRAKNRLKTMLGDTLKEFYLTTDNGESCVILKVGENFGRSNLATLGFKIDADVKRKIRPDSSHDIIVPYTHLPENLWCDIVTAAPISSRRANFAPNAGQQPPAPAPAG